VPLAEEGWTDDDVTRAIAARYLAPLKEAGVDALVLGCTHYPLLKGILQEVMGPEVALVDSAEAVGAEVHAWMERDATLRAPADATRDAHRFYVTDAPGPFLPVAERFLGHALGTIGRARLEGDAPVSELPPSSRDGRITRGSSR